MRRSPACRLVSLNVPEASTATYESRPLPMAVIAGKAAQTSREMPAKISFLRPVASMARATRESSNALTDERSMISMPGSVSTSSGNVGPHMLSRAVVVTTIGSFSALAALGVGNGGYGLTLRALSRPATDGHPQRRIGRRAQDLHAEGAGIAHAEEQSGFPVADDRPRSGDIAGNRHLSHGLSFHVNSGLLFALPWHHD